MKKIISAALCLVILLSCGFVFEFNNSSLCLQAELPHTAKFAIVNNEDIGGNDKDFIEIAEKDNNEIITQKTHLMMLAGANNQDMKKYKKEYVTIYFKEKAGNIVVDHNKKVITIPVKADVSYSGKTPEFSLPEGCSATLSSKGGRDLNSNMIYNISDGTKNEEWTITTREVYNNVVAAHVLNTVSIYGEESILQRNSDVKIWGDCEGAEIVTLEFAGQKHRTEVKNGKWEVTLSPMTANATAQKMTINAGGTVLEYNKIYVGDVWLCSGQSNMDMAIRYLSGNAYNDFLNVAENRKIRMFRVNRSDSVTPLDEFTKECSWSVPTKTEIKNHSAYAYAFAVKLEDELNIPIGIIDSSYGGTNIQEWMSAEALTAANTSYSISMYNSMINPLVGMSIKGILWYQGESNVNDPTSYTALFKAYADSYRELFNNPELPIITTQLPKFLAADYPNWHNFRLEQWNIAASMENVYIVCGIDLGDSTNIHPLDKMPFGYRAANLALNKVYSKDKPADSPYPNTVFLNGNTLTITFSNIDKGLTVDGTAIEDMYVVNGEDTAIKADAIIRSDNTIEIDVSGIASPKAVYYCYRAVPNGNLFDKNELPMAPFYLEID